MISSKLFGIVTLTYLACMALYFTYLFFRNKKLGTIVTGVVLLGWILQTVALGMRWYESYQIGYGHIPLSNLYESLISLTFAMAYHITHNVGLNIIDQWLHFIDYQGTN